MIIDFHTHIFPNTVAHRAVCNLEQVGRVVAYTDGTLEDLQHSMKEAGRHPFGGASHRDEALPVPPHQ